MTAAAEIRGHYLAYGAVFRLLKTRSELQNMGLGLGSGIEIPGEGNYDFSDGRSLPALDVGEYTEGKSRYYYYAWADSREQGENALLAYVNKHAMRLIQIQRS